MIDHQIDEDLILRDEISDEAVSRWYVEGCKNAAPIAESGRLEFQRLALIVDFVGFFLPLSFSPGSCTREEGFMVTLAINKDDP
jgi:hypothetical protein